MAIVVHRQSSNAIAGPNSHPFERLGEPPSVMRDLGPVGPTRQAFGPRSHDLSAAMFALGVIEDPHDAEWKVLHCAEHAHKRLPL